MSRSSGSGATDLDADGGAPWALAATVQPHGLLLVVQEPLLRIVQASTSAGALLQRPLQGLLLSHLQDLGGNLACCLQARLASGDALPLHAFECTLGAGADCRPFEGSVHRSAGGALVVELEPLAPAAPDTVDPPRETLLAQLGEAVQHFGEATSVAALAAAAARSVRRLLGYDHVVVSEIGADGRSRVIAEALDPRQPSLRARDGDGFDASPPACAHLLRQRLRVLVDVGAAPSALLPEMPPGQGGACDLSHSRLRSTSPQHAQRLHAQGVASSVDAALVCDGRLWGLIRCHHGRPRQLRHATRAAVELLAEAFGTRLLALENYARAQALAEVRRLGQRLLDATAADGDWHAALLRDQRMLLQPLQASGALLCHEGRTLACGGLPTGAARLALLQWLQAQPPGIDPVHCAALEAAHPARAAGVCGVLAVRLSLTQTDCLLWVRPEQGGTGSALPWTAGELSLAAAFGTALSNLMLQVNAVRMLIAASHLAHLRAAVAGAQAAAVVTDATQRSCYANLAFQRLTGHPSDELAGLGALAALFSEPGVVRRIVGQVRAEQRCWHGELTLLRPDGTALPLAVRAEPVPASDRALLGTVFTFENVSDAKRAEAARCRLESALAGTTNDVPSPAGEALLGALLANAGLAAMDIADGGAPAGVAPQLEEVQASTARAVDLLQRIQRLGGPAGG